MYMYKLVFQIVNFTKKGLHLFFEHVVHASIFTLCTNVKDVCVDCLIHFYKRTHRMCQNILIVALSFSEKPCTNNAPILSIYTIAVFGVLQFFWL